MKHVAPCERSSSRSTKPNIFSCQGEPALRECGEQPRSSGYPCKVVLGCREAVL